MLSLRRPSPERVRCFIAAQRDQPLTYNAVSDIPQTAPPGFDVDHTRVSLGQGKSAFLAARLGMQRWEQFRLGWVEVGAPETPIQVGEVVAVTGYALGAWWSNSCRIVAVVDETTSQSVRFGFTYVTLPDHMECGTECFLIEWNLADGSVWFDILAISKPQHLLARVGYPLMRRMQRRFARDAALAMQHFVSTESRDQRPMSSVTSDV